MGGVPYTDDYLKVTYNTEAAAKALAYYTDLQTKHKLGQIGFMDEGQAAFKAGKAAFTIDGTFRLGSFAGIKAFEWGVTELPANDKGVRSNYASYFANAITTKAAGEKKAAAAKFLAYLTSPEAMEIWLKTVGELPALRSAALTEANLANPIYAPFLKGLEYAHTSLFVDEAGQRQVAIDMVNRVVLNGQSPADSVKAAAEAEQAIIDRVTKK
jgi:multiple sugar transport system substrate-binding protein